MSKIGSDTNIGHKRAILVTCNKCKRRVDFKNTIVCTLCKNNFEFSCVGNPDKTKKWQCQSCDKRNSGQALLTTEVSNVTLRKKLHKICDNVVISSNSAQEVTQLSISRGTETEKENSDIFHDDPTTEDTLLSKSMDYTMTEAVTIQDMRDIIEQLRMDLATTQNEFDNIILDNNDLRSQVSNLTKENNTLKGFLSKTPPKESKFSNKKKIKGSLQYSDLNIIATPPRTFIENKVDELSGRNILTLEQNLKDLELHLKSAKNEIEDLNHQISTLQKALQSQKYEKSSLLRHTSNIDSEIDLSERPKLCVLTNSSSWGTLAAVDATFSNQFDYIRYLSPNSSIKYLLQNIDKKLHGYIMRDYCIVMLGEKDFKTTCNFNELVKTIREALQHISHTNIILCTPIYICGSPIYNYKIELFNNLLYSDLQINNYAYFYDSNVVTSLDMFSFKTGKINKMGIQYIYKNILDNINIDYSYYGYLLITPRKTNPEIKPSKFFLVPSSPQKKE